MHVKRPCPKCSTPNQIPVNANREFVAASNGTGSLTFTAQNGDDLAKLEAMFPKKPDGHRLVIEWVDEYVLRLNRVRDESAPAAPLPGTGAPTQAELEKLSKADLETKAAELGIEVTGSRAQMALQILEAIKKKAG